jgi:hypothetical protein
MMYFLDFDRALFDTDAYNQGLPDEGGCAPFAETLRTALKEGRDETLTGSTERQEAWKLVSEAIHSGALTFAPGYLSHFLYTDVPEFLREMGNEAIIVTYGEKERQRIKIESALAGVVRLTVLYTEHMSKASFLKVWPGYHGGPAIFVDDRVAELAELSTSFPKMKLFEMRRDGGAGDGRWPVIHSLAELP